MTLERLTENSLVPLRVIRTETVLSRLPIHNLAKKGSFDIQIVRRNRNEQVELRWEVSHSAKYGPPRQLAYKLDTLIVNRKIDETGRPVPRVLRLGSLRDIARELDLGGDTNSIRKALRQNAFTGITARLVYRSNEGAERKIEADFTRYNVVFAGEQLPDGRAADAVYIVLNDPYLDVVNNAPVRPLNYDYLKELPPSSQRFYEIVSYKIFSALKNGHAQARLLYSEYCTYAPQQRYFDYDHFKKQMYKVHRAHMASGYLAGISYKETRDHDGKMDWQMLYVPGPRAKSEFYAFDRSGPAAAALEAGSASKAPSAAPQGGDENLLELRRRGVSDHQAQIVLKAIKLGQPVKQQLEWADRMITRSQGRIYNPPGFYVFVLKQDIRPPDVQIEARPATPESSDEPQASDAGRRQAYEQYCAAEVDGHVAGYSEAQLKKLAEEKKAEILSQFRSARYWASDDLSELAFAAVRADLAKTVALPSFEEFDAQAKGRA